MTSTSTYDNSEDSLINHGLSMNIRSINSRLTQMFQRYSIIWNKIHGGDILGLGINQTKQIQNQDGIAISYGKGQIVVKNNIDKLKYLLNHKYEVASTIGISAKEINDSRRNLGKTNEYLSTLGSKYDLGEQQLNMQMYISRHESNENSLDYQSDWVDYILTQDWIDSLVSYNDKGDYRLKYLSEMIYNFMEDHNEDFHKQLEGFDESEFLNSGSNEIDQIPHNENEERWQEICHSRYTDAFNKLNSFNHLQTSKDGTAKQMGLDYGFYEIFKPIGGTNEKYIKVNMSTNGLLDIQGVIGLADCTPVKWEYGSQEYLRALNTGNRKYEFKLTLPFNDENSVLWWKPDDKEPLFQEEGSTEDTRYRYYKPYETERFLRWFGSTYIPMIEPQTIVKKTICSIPKMQAGSLSDDFYDDATNLADVAQKIKSTDSLGTIPLLSLAPKATIDIETRNDGQYLVFIVSGNQQTSGISFHLKGEVLKKSYTQDRNIVPNIQEINHYGRTLNNLVQLYIALTKEILYLETTRMNSQEFDDMWAFVMGEGKEYIMQEWLDLRSALESIVWMPKAIDLIRFRQIDTDYILLQLYYDIGERHEFIKGISGRLQMSVKNGEDTSTVTLTRDEYLEKIGKSTLQDAFNNGKYGTAEIFDETLYRFIVEDNNGLPERTRNELYSSLTMTEVVKNALNMTLSSLRTLESVDDYYRISYETTVDEIRERIQTFNNLIVRLPTTTYTNRLISLHIFQDWKNFVNRSLELLVDKGQLFKKDGELGVGTDGIEHEYTEYYVDSQMKTPLIAYDSEWSKTHDRFDYWSENDFK